MRELTRNQNYVVWHEYEATCLTLPGGRQVSLGHFYGDPQCALIDFRERWCVVGGCGLLVYFLREPFRPVEVFPSDQYAWVYGPLGNQPWVEAVYQPSDDAIRFVIDPYSPFGGVYQLRLPGLGVEQLLGRPPDDQG